MHQLAQSAVLVKEINYFDTKERVEARRVF